VGRLVDVIFSISVIQGHTLLQALAFGSLMLEGIDVRISGQDVGRGTFSHRHAMLVNQQTEGVIVPLNDELKADGKLELANSKCLVGFLYDY
jgi:2-oxoglutarate dehydrogenase complex dehydrogenase (E1) component-like enzyme